MAYATISKPGLHMNTKLYTGNGGSQSVTGVGFQPDWVWCKKRNASEQHALFDSVRGIKKILETDTTDAEETHNDSLLTFDSDGFSFGGMARTNTNGHTYASWNWKAGGASSSNSNGSITSTVSANTTAGFSVVTFGNYNGTVGHGLSQAPEMIIVKNRDDNSTNWYVYHKNLPTGSAGQGSYMTLNTNDSYSDSSGIWSNTAPTNQVFSIGSSVVNNANYVAYCLHSVKGFSKIGTYTGNGNADGTFVYTGFKPAFVMVKVVSRGDQYWQIKDSKRDTFNVRQKNLYPNQPIAEQSTNPQDFLSNGFKPRTNLNGTNGGGETYIYMAFAAEPFVANVGQSLPTTAT